MKKLHYTFFAIFIVIGMMSFVVAQDEELELPETTKVTGLQNALAKIGLAFTFNKEKRIEKALNIAERNLAAAESLSEEDPQRAEQIRERYEDFVAKAEETLTELEEEGANQERSRIYLEQLIRAQNNIESHREKIDAIYVRALERLENQNASDERIAKLEEIYEKSLERYEKVSAVMEQKKERIRERHISLTGYTNEQIEEELKRIEEEQGLTNSRQTRRLRTETRAQKYEAIRIREIEKAQNILETNENLSEEERIELEEKIMNSIERIREHKTITQNSEIRMRGAMPEIENEQDSSEEIGMVQSRSLGSRN